MKKIVSVLLIALFAIAILVILLMTDSVKYWFLLLISFMVLISVVYYALRPSRKAFLFISTNFAGTLVSIVSSHCCSEKSK